MKKHFETQIEGTYKYIDRLIDLTTNNKNLSQCVVLAKIKEINKRYNEIKIMNKEKQHLNMLLDLKYKIDIYDLLEDTLTNKKEICLVIDVANEVNRHIIEKNISIKNQQMKIFLYVRKRSRFFIKKM